MLPLTSIPEKENNGSKRLSPTGRFPSVDPSGRFAGVPNLGKPLYSEKTVDIKTHKSAINRPVDHIGET